MKGVYETPMFVSASKKQHLKIVFGADIMASSINYPWISPAANVTISN